MDKNLEGFKKLVLNVFHNFCAINYKKVIMHEMTEKQFEDLINSKYPHVFIHTCIVKRKDLDRAFDHAVNITAYVMFIEETIKDILKKRKPQSKEDFLDAFQEIYEEVGNTFNLVNENIKIFHQKWDRTTA